MTISNVQQLHDLAETSLSAYASIQDDRSLASSLLNRDTGGNFVTPQATRFTNQYRFRSQQDNVSLNGFSATVFEDKTTGRKVLAIRGTEFNGLRQALLDGLVADGLGIAGAGFAYTQTVELVRYWKRLQTPGGQAVQYSEAEAANLFLISAAQVLTLPAQLLGPAAIVLARSIGGFDLYRQALMQDLGIDSGTPGVPVIAAGERVDVSGHSLGGHLAQVFARIFPANVNEVVTLNAPNFFTQGDRFLSLLGYTTSQTASRMTRIEAEGDGIHLLGNVRYGTVVTIAQENTPGPLAAIDNNHSSVNAVDSLAVLAALARLDTRFANNAAGASELIRAASNMASNSYENTLDALRRAILGPGISPTPVSTVASSALRNDLYANLQSLVESAAYSSLVGNVTVSIAGNGLASQARARNDFQSIVALQTLSPYILAPVGPTGQAALDSLWQSSAWGDAYQSWLSDKASIQAGGIAENFTDAYLDDRAALLGWIALRNQSDQTGILVRREQAASTNYIDATTSVQFAVDNTSNTPVDSLRRNVIFGGIGNEIINGNAQADRLYGGAGTDKLSGLGGNDYLEGNSGDDIGDELYGGEGECSDGPRTLSVYSDRKVPEFRRFHDVKAGGVVGALQCIQLSLGWFVVFSDGINHTQELGRSGG